MAEARRDFAQVYRGEDSQFYFRIKSPNGETISDSEGYRHKQDAVDVIEAHFPDCSLIDLTQVTDE